LCRSTVAQRKRFQLQATGSGFEITGAERHPKSYLGVSYIPDGAAYRFPFSLASPEVYASIVGRQFALLSPLVY
jgi:hypothetical protein